MSFFYWAVNMFISFSMGVYEDWLILGTSVKCPLMNCTFWHLWEGFIFQPKWLWVDLFSWNAKWFNTSKLATLLLANNISSLSMTVQKHPPFHCWVETARWGWRFSVAQFFLFFIEKHVGFRSDFMIRGSVKLDGIQEEQKSFSKHLNQVLR